MEEIENASGIKVPVKAVDRATLGKEEAEKISAWLKQLEESSSGFLQLTRSDVVNFLIREHKTELSPRELQQIRTQHYDPIRHLNWITPRLKDALQKNDMVTVGTFQSEIRRIELSVVSKAKQLNNAAGNASAIPRTERRKREKKSVRMDPPECLSIAEIQTDLPEG